MIYHPKSPITLKPMSCIKLKCDNKFCDRALLCRWFATVASILEASDVEYENFLKQTTINFVVNQDKKSFSLFINYQSKKFSLNRDVNVQIPLIIGTKLWLFAQENAPHTIVNYETISQFKSTKTIGCPFCSIQEYHYLGCFYIANKLFHCPVFLYVDPTKLHVNRSTQKLRVIKNGQNLEIPQNLQCLVNEIFLWNDHFHNYAIMLYAWVQVKFFLILFRFLSNNCAKQQPTLVSFNTLLKRIVYQRIQQGIVSEAVSKTTCFKTTEMGGQSHETDVQPSSFNKDLAKSDIETRKGYIKTGSRYIQTPVNIPLMVMFAPLHCVKLISGQVLSNTHQCLHKSSIGFVCTQHTVDNKNAGMHLEFIPGIHIPSANECISDSDELFSLLLEATSEINCATESCNSNLQIKLFSEDMKLYQLNSSQIPKIDLWIRHFLDRNTIPFEFYYHPEKHVGFFRSVKTTPLNPKTLYTSSIHEWLKEHYGYEENLLPLMGVVASHGCLYNHSSTNKITAGLCGHRHGVGHPIGGNQIERSLCYPQNDMARRGSMPLPVQLAFTALICDAGNNVEDGLSVRADLADLQFAENTIFSSATITVLPCSTKVNLSFPNYNHYSYTLDTKQQVQNNINFQIPADLTRILLRNGSSLVDINGVSKVKSFSTNLQSISCQSSSRILFVEPYDTGMLDSGKRKIHLKSIVGNIGNSEINITFNFLENRRLQLGDKFSTLEGQKATVINFIPKEDMPFVISTDEIPSVDVLMNISAAKRNTYGMFASSLVRTAKCSDAEKFDLTKLMGDQSIGHHSNGLIADMLRNAEYLTSRPLADGRTGMLMGNADIFLCSYIKYNQEPIKNAFYIADGDSVQRSAQGDYVVRGKGRLGGYKKSQTDTWVYINQGMCLDIERQFQISGEPRLVHDTLTGVVKQSAAATFKSLALHGYRVITK